MPNPSPSGSGSTDEAIGRPEAWREGRYEQADKPVDQTVKTPPRSKPAGDEPESTPVTRKDYEG